MKKCVLIIILMFCLFGCANIQNAKTMDLINNVLRSSLKTSNTYRRGYKYFLPVNLNVISSKSTNEILNDDKYNYYLYVDLISYNKKNNQEYKKNDNAYISESFSHDNKLGFLEVIQKNNKYLIEIMYNYAKIEVIVDEADINKSITNSLIVLSTIQYNDNIISKLLEEDVLMGTEEELSIFETDSKDSNFLDVVEEYGTYEGEDAIPDYDIIN